ncbi:MAG TPA: hypothetical protein VGC51_10835 [Hansschlegelia sp.]
MPNAGITASSDDAKFAALEQRVYGLERGVTDLSASMSVRFGDVTTQIAGLGAKLDERSRTPWATIVSAMGVVLAIVIAGGQLAKLPIDQAVTRLERDTETLDKTTVPLSTFQEFKSTYENNRLLNKQDIDAKVAAVSADLRTLEARTRDDAQGIVPRGEHEERWRAIDGSIASVQRQVDDLKQALGGIYGARDVILDLRSRIDQLERGGHPAGRDGAS